MNTRILGLLFFFVLGMSLIGSSLSTAIIALARGEQDFNVIMLLWFIGAGFAVPSFVLMYSIVRNRETRIKNYQDDLAAQIKK